MTNRLANESSPYLLQHKENPVDWFPWCEEALVMAKEQDKPIFLSVGYSACHWCHVMEHESFENDAIARILNENFINIKVDREERPDLDQIYMNAVIALRNGQGGWPLSVFLTPDQEVFFGGTYWPPTSRVGMPGFDHVLRSVLDAFTNRREQVTNQSQQITSWLNQTEESDPHFSLDYSILKNAATVLQNNFDFENGGFGSAPKFPHAMDLALLVRLSNSSPDNDQALLDMVRINLKKMAYGGIFDHLAGGFARYSVDERWLVPHFEKMLYDNALMASVYLDMFRATGDQFYAMVARKTLDYLLKYLTDEKGGFHSTEDADSDGVEGKFYVWSREEILEILGQEKGVRFCELYNVTFGGNFEGSNILNMTLSYQQFADQQSIEKEDLRKEMREARKRLLKVRDQRVRPGKDDKVLVSWNALAISAFSKAGAYLNEQRFDDAAHSATDFIYENMISDSGRLLHTWRSSVAKIDAYLDDYSFLINALIDRYQYSFDQQCISRACHLTKTMIDYFDCPEGGFYFTADDQEKLIARQQSFQDSSIPSGNSMAALALIRLGRMTGKSEWIDKAQQTMVAASGLLARSPLACGQMLIAIHEVLNHENLYIVFADTRESVTEIQNYFAQNRTDHSLLITSTVDSKPVEELKVILQGKEMIEGQPTLYICRGQQCQQPVVGIDQIKTAIAE